MKELSAGYKRTTNNRMELMAVIEGLKALKKNDMPVKIYSDSQYVVKAIEEGWLKNWIKTNFKGGKKNKDLWTAYHESITTTEIYTHLDRDFLRTTLQQFHPAFK